ncbi:MAG: 4Fe-4S dicluster domain-containing protein [Gammaproteobacteria bacterium]
MKHSASKPQPQVPSMDRRTFFRQALRRTGETVVKHADDRAARRAGHWLRPPYAIDELEFLLACNRCGDCIPACTHKVIFSLPARLGAQVAGTPALDLLNKGCHLCDGWPCVAACETGALQLPANNEEETPLPQLAVASINTNACIPYLGPECGACATSCPVPGALVWEQERPHINKDKCVGCGLCREACIVSPKAIDITSNHQKLNAHSAP